MYCLQPDKTKEGGSAAESVQERDLTIIYTVSSEYVRKWST